MDIAEMLEKKRLENLQKSSDAPINKIIEGAKDGNGNVDPNQVRQNLLLAAADTKASHPGTNIRPDLSLPGVSTPGSDPLTGDTNGQASSNIGLPSVAALPAEAFGSGIDAELASKAICVFKEVGLTKLKRMVRKTGQSLLSKNGFFYCETEEDVNNGESYMHRGYLARCEVTKDGSTPVVGQDPKSSVREDKSPGNVFEARNLATGDTLAKPPEVVMAGPISAGSEKPIEEIKNNQTGSTDMGAITKDQGAANSGISTGPVTTANQTAEEKK